MNGALPIIDIVLNGLMIPIFLLVLRAAVSLEHRLTKVETLLGTCFDKKEIQK